VDLHAIADFKIVAIGNQLFRGNILNNLIHTFLFVMIEK
jgi:hypothetical protein